jgi:hypothetical protein
MPSQDERDKKKDAADHNWRLAAPLHDGQRRDPGKNHEQNMQSVDLPVFPD